MSNWAVRADQSRTWASAGNCVSYPFAPAQFWTDTVHVRTGKHKTQPYQSYRAFPNGYVPIYFSEEQGEKRFGCMRDSAKTSQRYWKQHRRQQRRRVMRTNCLFLPQTVQHLTHLRPSSANPHRITCANGASAAPFSHPLPSFSPFPKPLSPPPPPPLPLSRSKHPQSNASAIPSLVPAKRALCAPLNRASKAVARTQVKRNGTVAASPASPEFDSILCGQTKMEDVRWSPPSPARGALEEVASAVPSLSRAEAVEARGRNSTGTILPPVVAHVLANARRSFFRLRLFLLFLRLLLSVVVAVW